MVEKLSMVEELREDILLHLRDLKRSQSDDNISESEKI
jgi:hypothetical protein